MGDSFHQGWRREFSCPSPRESGPEPGRRRFFWRAGGVRMRAHRGRIQEQTAGAGERFGLQIFPQTRPDPARLPSPEAHGNGVPVTQLGQQIAPRTSGALEMKHRLEKLSLTLHR